MDSIIYYLYTYTVSDTEENQNKAQEAVPAEEGKPLVWQTRRKVLPVKPFRNDYFADPADDNPQQAAAAAAPPGDAASADGAPVEASAEAANGNDWELSDDQWLAIAAATP